MFTGRIGRRLPLTSKLLIITAAVGLCIWAVIDHVQSRELKKLLTEKLSARLAHEAAHDRARFDAYLRSHEKATKLFASQNRFLDYLSGREQQGWMREASPEVIAHGAPPPWYPRVSIARAFVNTRYALLIDPKMRVREIYQNGPPLPASMFRLDSILALLTHNDSIMTIADSRPFLFSVEHVHAGDGSPRGSLVLASPIDSEFILSSIGIPEKGHILALLEGGTSRVVASTDTTELPIGADTASVADMYSITGKSFFDYGISDLSMHFVTLVSSAEIRELNESILRAESRHRLISTLVLIAAFLMLSYWLARRIDMLTKRVVDFSENTLNFPHREAARGDQLAILSEQFDYLSSDIIRTHDSLRRAKEELEAKVIERTFELASAVSRLEAENAERRQAQQALSRAHAELEDKVRERTRDLARALEETRIADKAKGDFLASVSHELRTPMNGIIGLTELLLGTEDSPERRENLRMVLTSAESLLVIINDILDFSRISSGKLKLHRECFDVAGLFSETVSFFSLKARERGLKLSLDIDENLPEAVIGDPLRLKQVLVNLIGNALKFTEQGEIGISVYCQSCRIENIIAILISVSDTGVGIPAEQHERIFQSFIQADGSINRKYGGTGLGLAISSEIVGMMGGRLKVDSAPGRGSTFYFTAYFEKACAIAEAQARGYVPAAPPEHPCRPLKVLVVEDNIINLKLATKLLEKAGHEVHTTVNGEEAVEVYRTSGGEFDVMLMDIMMPVMDGLAATRTIREYEAASGMDPVRIIAMTANAMFGDREKCLAAGMDDYLAKPIKKAELSALLAKHCD